MVFHNTFDADRFIPGPPDWDYLRRLGLDPSNFIVLTVGRLNQDEPHKGHEQGIRAMADVVKQHPQARFVLAGSGNGDEYFRSVGDDVGLGDKLIMPGFVSMDELQTLFNACNLFLLPSSQEGFGIVFLEAMGCGKPVIGGNIDGSVDPLCDGELGTLIDPREIDEIVAAITDHIEQRIPKDKIDPVHLRKEAISRFGYDRFRQRLREVIAAL
jgi:glycosyltransferase involved in cell wall biosynthesis